MDTFLPDLSSPALVSAIFGNVIELVEDFATLEGVHLHREAHVTWLESGIPDPQLNYVFGTDLPPEETVATIERLQAHFQERRLPVCWWIGPGSRDAAQGRHLEEHGWFRLDTVPGMAIDLSRDSNVLPAPSALTIERVENEATLKEWMSLLALCFEMSNDAVQGCLRVWSALCFSPHPRLHSYLARLEGEPVATANLFLGSRVAGIYSVCTHPDVRGKGIGAAITLAPLREARAHGYHVSILHATPMGFPVYRRLGFQHSCTFEVYVLLNNHEGSKTGEW